MTDAALTLTGERTLPGIERENYWFRRHEAAYRAIAPFCRGALVLDAGCGEGYGAALLRREGAGRVVALDVEAGVVAHAATRYPSVDVAHADLHRLPVRGGAIEVVVTSQTVEHLHDQAAFVTECARVLRPAGTLVVTTPNRLTFSPGLAAPVNPFHTRELSPDELVELLAPDFAVTRLLGVHHGRRLSRWERRHGSLVTAQLAAEPDRWPAGVRTMVRGVRVDDFTLSPYGVDSSLDLVAVAVRRPARR